MLNSLLALRLRLRALLRAEAVDADLQDEIHLHLQQLIDEKRAAGMSAGAARAAALREFGGVPQIVEECRDARGIAWITNLAQDFKYGVRLMRRSPGFAAATVLTVALGIGATTAMFSIVYGVLLQRLPYADPDRLVNIWNTAPKRGLPRANVGMANVYDFKARNHVFEDIAALRPIASFNLTGQGEPERLNGARVAAGLFPLLGVTPLVGRTFTEDEDEIGHERVAVLSYGLWQRRFAADPAIVGRAISLSGVPHTVVGVMRSDFAYPNREYQIYTPLTFDPQELMNRQNYSYLAVARMKPGVTLEQARAELTLLAAQIEREHPKENEGIGVVVVPMLSDTVTTVRTPLYVLLGAVLAMLLIGCANLANLLLARALARRRELAVRAALGAARGRLVAQSIAELVPMLVTGGTLGIVAAGWAIAGLVPLLPADVPRVESIGLDVPVLLFAIAMLVAIAVFVGVWPALDASRGGLAASADLSRSVTGGPGRARVRDLLIVAQVAATLWLTISATLFVRSLSELKRVDPGFNPERVYSLHLAIPRSKYPKDRDVAEFSRRLLERVTALPDVVAAGMVNRLPLAGGVQTAPIEFEGVDPTVVGALQSDLRTVTPDYFRTLQIPLVSGRTFTERDDADAPLVGIIDDQLARTVLRGRSAIGQRFRVPIPGQPWITIVGVVGHIRHDRLDEDVRPQVYWNYKQRMQDRMALVVRTHADAPAAMPSGLSRGISASSRRGWGPGASEEAPAATPSRGQATPRRGVSVSSRRGWGPGASEETIGPSLVAVIRSVDPEQPVYDARTLEAVVDRSLAQRWLQTTLLGAFALVALLLASIGVYGVIAYGVGQRRREFGIRLALGAHRREIVGLVMRRGVVLFAMGASLGLLAAGATGRVLATLLFNVAAFDLLSVGSATVILFMAALAACYLPARRAGRVDPSIALRAE